MSRKKQIKQVSEDSDYSEGEDSSDYNDEYSKYTKINFKILAKKHPHIETKQLLRIIAYEFIALKNHKKKKGEKPAKKSYWIVFHNDEGNREDCSVPYSHLVYAYTAEEAIMVGAMKDGTNITRMSAEPMQLCTIDTMNSMIGYPY